MSLKSRLKTNHTLAYRLTVWYASIFAMTFFGAALFLYILMTSTVHKRMDQDLLNEVKEFSTLLQEKGMEEFKTSIIYEAESEGVENVFYRLISREGSLIASSDISSWGFLSDGTALNMINTGSDNFFETIPVPGTTHHARILYIPIDEDRIIQTGESMEEDEKFLETFRDIFGTTFIIMIVIAGLAGWFMARRALAGVEEITKTAVDISCGDFSSRVSETGHGDEIDRLAIAFNRMLDHIRTLIKGMKEVNDNIAHDLRSPIARIRGITETAMMPTQSGEDYQAAAGSIIEECDRLLGMINTMLDISEAEAGMAKMNMEETDISDLISDACELFLPLAEDRHITLRQEIERGVLIHADQQKIQRVIANLLDNALKYTQSDGTVTVFLNSTEHEAVISLADNGIGISKDDLPNIFNRFYRCDRSRSLPGVGLGLSLAQAIVRAHGGDISATSLQDKGSTFTLTLPFNH